MHIDIHKLDKPMRLDRVLRDRFPGWGRQAVQKLISAKKVRVNGKAVWLASWKVNNGDTIELLEIPAAKPTPPQRFDNRWLLAQDADLIVVNKPAGLLSEAPRFRDNANLLDLAKARFGDLILFHRLDRDTSGLILLTRPGPVNQYLARAFQTNQVQKTYLAVVSKPNQLQSQGTISARLDTHSQRRDMMAVVARGGKHAVTDYAITTGARGEQARGGQTGREQTGRHQLVKLYPRTGRTHQLRVHLAHLGAPILGDRLYGDPTSANRLLLHAHRLVLPADGGWAERTLLAPTPDGFL